MKLDFYVKTLVANAVVAATALSAALAITEYEGRIAVILDAIAQGSGITTALKLQHSDASGGTYSDVTGGGFVTVGNAASKQTLQLNSDDLKAYLKLSYTIAGGSATGAISVSVVGFKKYN